MPSQLVPRGCSGTNVAGRPCRQAPQVGKDVCFWHDPENEQARAEAVRLGGQNRRREQTLATIYGIAGDDPLEDAIRYVGIAQAANLALDNSVPRNRGLVAGAQALADIYEKTVLSKKIDDLMSVLGVREEQREPIRKRIGRR